MLSDVTVFCFGLSMGEEGEDTEVDVIADRAPEDISQPPAEGTRG